jgi:hypothetical protein
MSRVQTLSAVTLAVIGVLALPGGASASWSRSMRVPQSAGGLWPAAAVNARGDVAVAWIQEGRSHGHATLRVRAAIRAARADRFSVRTLVAARDLAARGAAVALDARGELTVAWIQQASDNGRWHGRKTVRAAYRRPSGRWSRVQAIGRSLAFNYATPRLAARADGTVVLTYNSRTRAAPGVAASWRVRGRPFGSPQSVPTGRQYLFDPTLAVDPAGRAFLTGTRGCNQLRSDVIVVAAPPGRRRFTTRTTVTSAPGKAVRMAVMGPGAVALAWVSGTCDTTEDLGGRPFAAAVRNGVAGTPVALGDGVAMNLIAGRASAGADVTFSRLPPDLGQAQLMTSRITADGAVGAPVPVGDSWVALAGDPAGDQLVGQPGPFGSRTTPLAARPASGAPIEPAPLAAVGYPWTNGTVAASHGRALAALSFTPPSSMTPSIALAVWRP